MTTFLQIKCGIILFGIIKTFRSMIDVQHSQMLEELLRLLKLGIRVFYYHYSLIIFSLK